MFSLSLHCTNQVTITICVLQTARQCLSHLKTLRTDSENCICYLRKQFVWIPGAHKDTVTLSLSRHWGCCSSGSRTKCTQRCFTESTRVVPGKAMGTAETTKTLKFIKGFSISGSSVPPKGDRAAAQHPPSTHNLTQVPPQGKSSKRSQ